MRFEFTIRGPGGDCDVAVESPVAVRLRDVRARLLVAVGGRPDASIHGAPADAELGDRELRTGAVLSLDRPAPLPPSQPARQPLTAHVIGGRDAGLSLPIGPGDTSVGRDLHCRLVLDDDVVSREHAVLSVGPAGITVRDLRSTNGTAVEGVTVPVSGRAVEPDDVVRVGNTLLALRDRRDTAIPVLRKADRCLVTLPPRGHLPPDGVIVDVAAPPRRPRPRPTQWLAALLPAMAGGALAWLTRSPVFLLFALLSPLMLLSTALGDRWHWRRSGRRERLDYEHRRTQDDEAVRTALHAEVSAARRRFPDLPVVAGAATVPTDRLWERRSTDPDLLCVRLGTADLPARTQVRSDGQEKSAAVLPAMPLVIDLRSGPLGLVGPPESTAGVARALIAQLTVLHAPGCLRLAIVVRDPDRAAHWAWARWLPHLGDRVACEPVAWRRLAEELTSLASADADSASATGVSWTVALVDLVGHGDTTSVDLAGIGNGPLSAIVVAERADRMPSWCARVLDLSRNETVGSVIGTTGRPRLVVIDEARPEWAEDVARALAPLTEAVPSVATQPPTSCHLLDVAGIEGPSAEEVLARWAACNGRLGWVVGATADGPLEIDLTRDGPHALIAGTTGAGKSELLRSLVLGLALDHPPDAVTFVLVDFKGGATFTDCAALPHVVGSVTDLDPHLTRRALESLNAELHRRERLFAEAGTADLDAYRVAGPRVPVPRLVIVVDEFAALADELPDVLRGVVSVAQRGRSLGVHLVLATQRPGSAVTAEIRANTALRIALRVVDSSESHEIVGVPLAAAIPPGLPGRAVLRTGESTRMVQTACVDRVARVRSSELAVERLGPWRRKVAAVDPSGTAECSRIVGAVRAAVERRDVELPAGPWLPPLPENLAADALDVSGPTCIALGLVDLPAEQRRQTLEVDLDDPSAWLLVGSSQTGRSTALAGIALGAAARFRPSELEIYVVDAGGPLAAALAGLPHVATCVGPDELAAAATLVRGLTERGAGAARTLLLVDNAERVLVGDEDAPLVSAGGLVELRRRTGVCVLAAGSRALLATRVAGGFEHRLVLRQADRGDYSLAGVATRDIPSRLPPGRAVRVTDGAEVQLAYRGSGPSTVAAGELAALVARRDTHPGSATAVRIRPLPRTVQLADLPTTPGRLRLGRTGDSASALSIDPFAGSRRWLVAGPARSGRSTALLTLLAEACRTATPVLVAAPPRSPLLARAAELGITTTGPESDGVLRPPSKPTLVLVDDIETFAGRPIDALLGAWAEDDDLPLSFVIAGRGEELAASYLGLAAVVRRARSGLLLQPGPLDGGLFGVRLPATDGLPPGRGVLIGEPAWFATPEADARGPVAIQVAHE